MCLSVCVCVCVRGADLQYVAPDVVSQGPAQAVQDVQHLLLLEHGEEAVQQDLEPDWDGLGAVEHQAADVEHHVGLHDLHLGRVVQVLGAQLVQGWEGRGGEGRRKGRPRHRQTRAWLTTFWSLWSSVQGGSGKVFSRLDASESRRKPLFLFASYPSAPKKLLMAAAPLPAQKMSCEGNFRGGRKERKEGEKKEKNRKICCVLLFFLLL